MNRAFTIYREVFLHSISDEQILAAACRGSSERPPWKVLRRFRGDPLGLRAHLSRTLGEIEREHHKIIPEWAAPCQTFLVDTLAAGIEVALFGAPCLQVGAAALQPQRRKIVTS